MAFSQTHTHGTYRPDVVMTSLRARATALEAAPTTSQVHAFNETIPVGSATQRHPTPVTTYKSSGFDDYFDEVAFMGAVQLWYTASTTNVNRGVLFEAQTECIVRVDHGFTDNSLSNLPMMLGVCKYDGVSTPLLLEGYGGRDANGRNMSVTALFTCLTGDALGLFTYHDGSAEVTTNSVISAWPLPASV